MKERFNGVIFRLEKTYFVDLNIRKFFVLMNFFISIFSL